MAAQGFGSVHGVPDHAACKEANPAAGDVGTSGGQAQYGGQLVMAKLLLKNGTSEG